MERKIIEYYIISQPNIKQVVEEVNKRIGDGWQPFGDLLTVGSLSTGFQIYQPMVKYADQ